MPQHSEGDGGRFTESGIPVEVCYGPDDLDKAGFDPATALGEPGPATC